MPETATPVRTTRQRGLKAFWETVGLTVLVAAVILTWKDWTFLWIALGTAVVAFPVFWGSDTLIAKYSSATGDEE